MNRTDAARIGGMDRQTLRDWVHKSGVRQQALARKLGRPQSFVVKYEGGGTRLGRAPWSGGSPDRTRLRR